MPAADAANLRRAGAVARRRHGRRDQRGLGRDRSSGRSRSRSGRAPIRTSPGGCSLERRCRLAPVVALRVAAPRASRRAAAIRTGSRRRAVSSRRGAGRGRRVPRVTRAPPLPSGVGRRRGRAATMHEEVRAGRLDGEAVAAVLSAAGHRVPAPPRSRPGSPRREVDVLVLLAQGGLSNPQIAGDVDDQPQDGVVARRAHLFEARRDLPHRAPRCSRCTNGLVEPLGT